MRWQTLKNATITAERGLGIKLISYMDLIKMELTGIYGDTVLADMYETIKLYDVYEGKFTSTDNQQELDYTPTNKQTNFIKKLIKDKARFLFGKTPEFKVKSKDKESAEIINEYINTVLKENHFGEKLIKAARDCFIGKKVAVKLIFNPGKPIKISFRNALEFVFETVDGESDELKSIVFFYSVNNENAKEQQRIWKQSFRMVNGTCIMNQGIYNGYGKLIESVHKNLDTGLDFIPARVIVNDGLSGDILGESDVAELKDLQKLYNKLTCDDADALRFNMFPQTVAVGVSEESIKNIKIAPQALIDVQTEATNEDMKPEMYKLESNFNYDSRLENALNRIKSEMFELMSVPDVSLDNLTGLMTSGKAMKALYWQLITHCEEKYATWRSVLEWIGYSIVKMGIKFEGKDFNVPEDMIIEVENVYPLMEDEYEEKTADMAEVREQIRSRKSYIGKWQLNTDAGSELKQIAIEQKLLQDAYVNGMDESTASGAGASGD